MIANINFNFTTKIRIPDYTFVFSKRQYVNETKTPTLNTGNHLPEHNEICVGTTKAVMRVGIVVGIVALFPDKVHDLVLTFARAVGVGEDDLWFRSAMNCDVSTRTLARPFARTAHKFAGFTQHAPLVHSAALIHSLARSFPSSWESE